ncbi:MAG: phosphoadenosine phosphosulfate reductase family protein, partial [Burkholderiales bacterium]|nr:phosphoadenosine phosphosulfate reductase family protein [Burkholderiales bacterium]
LDPSIWITALRKVQNPNREGMDIVTADNNFGTVKVNPVFYLTDADMEAYLKQNNLPNEWDYFDPAKADEKRECGLHAAWGGEAVYAATRARLARLGWRVRVLRTVWDLDRPQDLERRLALRARVRGGAG